MRKVRSRKIRYLTQGNPGSKCGAGVQIQVLSLVLKQLLQVVGDCGVRTGNNPLGRCLSAPGQ